MAHSTARLVTEQRNTNLLASLSEQLAALERRDWHEWLAFAITSLIVAVGFLTTLFPSAFFRRSDVHLELTVSKELFFGLIALLILFNSYTLWKRMELRRTRERLISTTIQSELIRLQSFTDPLTEVYNRRSLDDMAGRYISRARRLEKPLTFALLDVNRFKEVNTRFGHLTGDFVLAEIAALLRNSVRGADAVVRYGGDEFIIILADCAGDGGRVVMSRLEHFIEDWNHAGHLEGFSLRVSIGLSEWHDGMTLDEVLDQADRDMYANKATAAASA